MFLAEYRDNPPLTPTPPNRPRRLRPPHGRVHLRHVQPPPLLVHRRPPVHLRPLHTPTDALHVRHDEHAHCADTTAGQRLTPTAPPTLPVTSTPSRRPALTR